MTIISVIVPVYKVEPYIRRCIDSILSQTFTDFELVLVDDGSPDNCGAICDEYAAKDVRVHVIHQPNGGPSAARNTGIDWAFANSDSKWFAFVDSDDWVHPQYLELLYKAVKENGTLISACDFQQANNELSDPVQLNSETTLVDWETFLLEYYLPSVVAWNKLYARELFIGLRYPIGRDYEDEFLLYKILYRAKTILFFRSELYYYFQNPSSFTHQAFSLKRIDAIDAYIERSFFTKKHGSHRLFEHDLNALYYLCSDIIDQLWKSESIPVHIKKEKELYFRREMRLMILRCRVLPQKHHELYYFAFPNCVKLAKKTKRLIMTELRGN